MRAVRVLGAGLGFPVGGSDPFCFLPPTTNLETLGDFQVVTDPSIRFKYGWATPRILEEGA